MVVILAGCTPPWSSPDVVAPVASRSIDDGGVEVLLTRCSPGLLERFEILIPDGPTSDDTPQRWVVEFDPPADVDAVVLGEVPPEGEELLPWPTEGLGTDRDARHTIRVTYSDGETWISGFRISDHDDGRVRFHRKNRTAQQFAEIDTCERVD